MVLGLLVVGLGLTSLLSFRYILGKETVRTRLTENLRGSLDILGADIRVAGENVGSSFPAIEVTDGAAGAPDTLLTRRNLLDAVLPLCTAITSGTSVTKIYFANGGGGAGCVYSGQTSNFNSWKSYRAALGSDVDAFIYDTVNKRGEFFKYHTETDAGTSYSLTRTAGTWANSYSVGATAIYVLEEWKYLVSGGILEVIQNRDAANPLKVSFGITDFQVHLLMQDGTTKASFAPTDSWSLIKLLQIDLSGSDSYSRRNFVRTVTGKFFPRNVLSN